MSLTVSCVQLTSSGVMAENIAMAEALVREAAGQGAQLVCLPENAFLMRAGEGYHEQIFVPETHPALAACRSLAQGLGIWLLVGSLAVKGEQSLASGVQSSETNKYLNRSYLINDKGVLVAYYDKIHLFDVALPSGERHEESRRFHHGGRAVLVQTPWGGLGMSVCYDVRFPHLYRTLAKRGADFLTVPAAFTRFTGEKGGWHVLCRARAMENGCFVFAPAQCGTHPGGRQTYGHSLIVNPWGDILAEAGEAPGIITATIDPDEVGKTRAVMPSLQHDREFE